MLAKTHESSDAQWPELMKFAAIMLQLVLLALLIKRYELESPAFFELTVLAFGGFAVHYFLPMAVRLPFFLALSVASIVMVLGATQAVWLLGIGLAIVAVCHAPLPFWVRVTLLAAMGAVLAAMRGGVIPSVVPMAIWPILGSMFLFRLVVYLYDLHYQTAPVSTVRSLSYFFMLPNVCFPLFPVVDYQSFCRNYYDGDRNRIHQVGVHWIFRGAVHLLLYRILYMHWGISLYDVENAGDLVHYSLWLFLLYLRVSGQFHIIVGMLHLFGFNLAETHHLYYLSSSFTDFWRRINIYWKDFMMKIFFYPVYFRIKGWGPVVALVVSTLVVFVLTWLLHAVQWFWLRGSFLWAANDVLFWSILAVLVVVNSLWEVKRGRNRKSALGQMSWPAALVVGLKTLATFTVICGLWSLWTSESASAWLSLWQFALVPPTAGGWALIAFTVVTLVGSAALAGPQSVWLRLEQNVVHGRVRTELCGNSARARVECFFRQSPPRRSGAADCIVAATDAQQDGNATDGARLLRKPARGRSVQRRAVESLFEAARRVDGDCIGGRAGDADGRFAAL